MQQHRTDTLLLEHAYRATQLKQHLPNMSVQQLQLVIENASPTELEVIEEFVGGLKNIGKAAAAKAKEVAAGAGDAVRGAGKAVAAGAKQVAGNVKDMYQTGEAEAAAGKRKKQLLDHIGQLEQLFTQHIEASPHSRLAGQDVKNLTLAKLKQALTQKEVDTGKKATASRDKGFTGGVGDAAKAGYQAGSAPAPAPAPAGGAPAPA